VSTWRSGLFCLLLLFLASLVAFETRSVVVHFWDLYSLLDSSVLMTSRFWEGFLYIFILGYFHLVIVV